MSLSAYVAELEAKPDLGEIELYGPLDAEIMRGVLGYPKGRVRTHQRREDGIPDLTLYSDQDEAWVVCEVKGDDDEIRREDRRRRLWEEQARRYIEPETLYVCLIGPRTLYVCDLAGKVLEGVHIEELGLADALGGDARPLSDDALGHALAYHLRGGLQSAQV